MHIIKLSICNVNVLADRMCERIRGRRYVYAGECYPKGYDQGSLVGLLCIVCSTICNGVNLSTLKQEHHLNHFLNRPTNLGFRSIQCVERVVHACLIVLCTI